LGKEDESKIHRLSIKKIVVIGPESTGKSSLSGALAATLETVWVPEYARAYLEQLNRPYEEEDVLAIARGQLASEQKLETTANGYLICDTDLNVVKVWSEHKYGRCNREILEAIAVRRYDLYLLTYIDVAWQDDPLREHPEEGLRSYFYHQYKDIVMNSGVPWVEIKGTERARLTMAVKAINEILTEYADSHTSG